MGKAIIAAIIAAFVAFLVTKFLTHMIGIGLYGLASLVVPLVVAIFVFMKFKPSLMGTEGAEIRKKVTRHGTPTFSWKDLDVYRDQGFLIFRGRKYGLEKVTRISYETGQSRGCMGGEAYLIHVHMNDMATPRLTFVERNIFVSGNQKTVRDYERLGMALGLGN